MVLGVKTSPSIGYSNLVSKIVRMASSIAGPSPDRKSLVSMRKGLGVGNAINSVDN